MKSNNEITLLKDILPDTLKKLNINKNFNIHSVIFNWRKIVGNEIANNSQPLKIERATLILNVKNSVWSHHLLMLKKELINKINNYIGENLIVNIWFKAGNCLIKKNHINNEENRENEENIRPLKLDANEIELVKKITDKISDVNLKNKITYVLIKQAAFEKGKRVKNWKTCVNCESLVPLEETYCGFCKREKKEDENRINRQRIENIKKILWDTPWFRYDEVNEITHSLKSEYYLAKKELIRKLARNIFKKNFNKASQTTLVMLISEIGPNNLTQKFINDTVNKIKKKILENAGRKKYVSSSRN